MPRRSLGVALAEPDGAGHYLTMIYVYILESHDMQHWYIGVTDDINRRLSEHNSGQCIHTNKHKPWKLKSFTAFHDRERAEAFEKYLKSHSGRAFTKKHL